MFKEFKNEICEKYSIKKIIFFLHILIKKFTFIVRHKNKVTHPHKNFSRWW